jgi:hypothetical protein
MCWVLRLLNLTRDCSQCVVLHSGFVALQLCVSGICHEYICVYKARQGEQLVTHCSAAGCVLNTLILVDQAV